MQRFALFIYKALGWKIKGRFPEEINKMVKLKTPIYIKK